MDLHRFFPHLAGDDAFAMPAPLFFKIAQRLAYYDGAVTVALRRAEERASTAVDAATAAPGRAPAPVDTQAADGNAGPLVNGIRAPRGAKVVTFAELAAQNPDLIGLSKVG